MGCFVQSFVASIPMADAVVTRNHTKKALLSLLFVSVWMVLAVCTGLDEQWKPRNGGLSIAFAVLGAQLIIVSMKVLRMHRKMGDSWEQEGKENPTPRVYSPGAFLF